MRRWYITELSFNSKFTLSSYLIDDVTLRAVRDRLRCAAEGRDIFYPMLF
jgi:hypothetical protein